ncbi:MAG: tRNA (cytidine(34)-2'-O)-methyltransferase [Chlamydiia bacterium]|nr:tRNA (cytidine(34)-2'-O)-methyltransferase [Chlamydiia bacterium]
MQIILYQPQIPQNTGNIVRSCAVTGTSLTLVHPLGFQITDRWLKRAGLDYWEGVNVNEIDSLEDYLETLPTPFWFFSSKAKTLYADVTYSPDSALIFGSETTGLPPLFHERWPERFVTLPMRPNQRCLNLATSCGIALFEAWRQNNWNFP